MVIGVRMPAAGPVICPFAGTRRFGTESGHFVNRQMTNKHSIIEMRLFFRADFRNILSSNTAAYPLREWTIQ
jgi:hypothetical protein